MTDKKISELTSNGTLTGSELVELVQSGSNVKALLSAIKTFITTGYLTSETAASTYQTQSGMSSYLTSATASATYATIAQAKKEYLTIAPPATRRQKPATSHRKGNRRQRVRSSRSRGMWCGWCGFRQMTNTHTIVDDGNQTGAGLVTTCECIMLGAISMALALCGQCSLNGPCRASRW